MNYLLTALLTLASFSSFAETSYECFIKVGKNQFGDVATATLTLKEDVVIYQEKFLKPVKFTFDAKNKRTESTPQGEMVIYEKSIKKKKAKVVLAMEASAAHLVDVYISYISTVDNSVSEIYQLACLEQDFR
jgi:hypothetical protein